MLFYTNNVLSEDLQKITEDISFSDFRDKTILITGANGMLATYLSFFFLHLNLTYDCNLRLILLSRNGESLSSKFSHLGISRDSLSLLTQDVSDPLQIDYPLDYILHFAGNASPLWIEKDPVGIMKANLLGTMNLLEHVRKMGGKLLYASTREVYGKVVDHNELSETTFGSLDCLSSRSCYPESKRVAETLCKSYLTQYGVDFNTVRISHVYGPGMKLNDGRVMSDMVGSAVEGKEILLRSRGEAIRSFCYISDAISGILKILIQGRPGEAYNLANEVEEISVIELAKLMLQLFPNKIRSIEYELFPGSDQLYCNYSRVKLDTVKLQNLGWLPKVSLREGLIKTVRSFE